ncbi:deoxyribodipyrimidine photolyase-related protein [Granulicella aggregans]|uniref:Deoxyribodipyrimidine photolyase-related protein n=1 Tax=Granulicella aggregans TaxID=474949 RepID=A0A7W8E1Y6_9BACT|nr:cryptochrome/photolyase family protein [Granulicella aggregans]MBB5055624.1 deoxyribodipyrimidine photolyase-related protein [Granulicella aggregans]
MAIFAEQIRLAYPTPQDLKDRRWIYVPYDRFTDRTGPLTEQPASATGIVIVESTAKAHRRPYHKKKLVLLISNMRHFALEQAARGCKVIYQFSEESHARALLELQRSLPLPELSMMQPAERELRLDIEAAILDGLKIKLAPDTTWLSTIEDFLSVFGPYKSGRSYVMDRFYRTQRQKTGILMDKGKPRGGKFSFDAENRKPYKGLPLIPQPPVFAPDEVTNEVITLVEQTYPHHFGLISNFNSPVTQQDADLAWAFALEHLLPHFGPYEDAMRDDELQLFHSRLSGLINLGRLLPSQMTADVEAACAEGLIPLASAEGFIRQILGWREFMRHLHQQTDGYRLLAGTVAQEAGSKPSRDVYAGATPSALSASLPLPAAYWGVKSGLHCLDTVVAQVIEEGWSHHITRLMVLSNLATLGGFSPRQLTDWFWFAYVDAYDWVVETNVLGMATYADGGLTATKPYVSGAAYINKMSNFCGHCQYDPKRSTGEGSCPFTALYWTFLERNESVLGNNFRLQMPYTTLRKKSPIELVQLRARAQKAIDELQQLPHLEY